MSTKLQTSPARRLRLPRTQRISVLAFLAVTVVISVLALRGVPQVPFHPDESTFLFLSGDFERQFSHPAKMAWQPEKRGDRVQLYRTLDAPLGRMLVGFGRWTTRQAPLPVDWDWGQSWQTNRQAGALPERSLLLAGRYAMAALLPLSMLLLFFTGRRAGGEFSAWTAALLLASNALVLMLGRRAVSEGALIFTATWTLFSLVYAQKRPWLTALPAGLAFCAKHSLGALAPVGLVAILWQPHIAWGTRIRQAGLYLALYLAVVLALNPFLWAHPIAALQDAAENRRVLAANQVADRPEQELATPRQRVIAMIGALYLTPPFLAEVGNYLEDTHAQDAAYLANPLHSLLRSLPAGGLLLAVTLFGCLNATRQVLWQPRQGSPRLLPGDRRALSLLLIAAALQTAALLVLVPLPFQRYYLPLVPHACLWAAFGLRQLARPFFKG